MSSQRIGPALACALLLIGGCAGNLYRKNYTTELSDKAPKGEATKLENAPAQPELLTTDDMKADGLRMLELGYRPIGVSKFISTFGTAAEALQQAKDVGAEYVVVMRKYVGSDVVSVPVQEWSPARRIIMNTSNTNPVSDRNGPPVYGNEAYGVIEGEYETRFVPKTVEVYDHRASFWKMADQPVLGVLGSNLDEVQSKASGSNRGVAVRVVVRNSPAFDADIFRGDIIQQIGTHEVVGTYDLFEKVHALSGTEAGLKIWRDGKIVLKTVALARR